MSNDPIRLQNAQRDIRDAYFDHDSGLYTLNCVPGAGKSEVTDHISAEDILRRYVAGDSTPEQRVATISFNRSEAEHIIPDICDRLREIVEHDLVPAASQVSDTEVEYLIQRVRQAPFVGTIDSILRDVLSEIAPDIGFEEMPVVGNTARQQHLHAACYQAVQMDSDVAQRVERLEAAYPTGEYDDDVSEMLETAATYCRDRRISTERFRSNLEQTVEDVYAEGRPGSFSDIVAAVEHCVGADSDKSAYDDIGDDDRHRICDADSRLHDDWRARIDDFCTVLETYRSTYRQTIRDHGVVSHTDVAYLVDAYFDDQLNNVDDAHRTRIKQRYQTRIQSLIIDEAQDVSSIQHAALSHLITPSARVFGAGDLLQSVYLWRHAEPTLFETATVDGEYLGIDWDLHEHRTAKTTYRCVPDVASAINEISEAALTDPARGNLGELDVRYPGLEAARGSTEESNVHIAAFDPIASDPDSYTWVNPAEGRGEATTLATLLSKGLADGTFTDENDDPLGITVLFRWSSKMEAYEEAFEEMGLSVRNASEDLFESPVVKIVLDVCEWLSTPADPERTRKLVTESNLGLESLADTFETHQWDIDAILNDCDLSDTHQHVLAGLAELRDRRDSFLARPAGTYAEDIIDTLALRADPDGHFDVNPAQRVANLDALVATLHEWEADEHFTPRELTELVEPFRENPYLGPNQPSTSDTSHDVEFRTIHDAKGDQDDVVAIANPGFDLWTYGPQAQRFLTQGSIAGLAPPTNTDIPSDVALPPFVNGLYDPEETWDRDVGLRWATGHWCDDVVEAADSTSLVGPERLRRVAANERAEAWRVLYVALTRARDHLVVPLPRSLPGDPRPRDRWLDTIRDGLNFTGGQTGTYTVDTETRAFDVGVNDVALRATWTNTATSRPDDVAVNPPRRTDFDPWVPRFTNPSTLYPLTDDPDAQVLGHLLGNALHTEANGVPDDIPLQFDELGPDDVGSCLHEMLTILVERTVSEEPLRSLEDDVRYVFDDVVNDYAPRIDDDEREGLFTFFRNEVLDDFLASELWNRIQRADRVSIEKPVDGLVTIDGVEIEVHGTSDFVVELPSGERHVADVKITLTNQTPETRRRYELQVTAYAYLFEQQERSTNAMNRTVETFGVERNTVESSWPLEIVERRLAALVRQ
ncbi:UvrD-helicase domain-containing protein [Halobacterium salinarum]|uniref:UvrD-helicase domain-containing protein n=1 Tax=Halobacterium salinarum TaxID=2242 RepID=UPI00255496E4|nr:UvrD-helicase domain-containing protein [Halobacterium salinarum]MDL0123184.1 UvrD-helicase domain-containing protein [Halobacterium salinarum]